MFNKYVDLREWRDWTSFLVGVAPLIISFLKSVDSYILYYSCALVAIVIATVRLFLKEKTIRNIEEEKDKLKKMISQKWVNWGDDELTKNPEAWDTLRDYLKHSFSANNVPDKIRHDVLTSLDDIYDYISPAWSHIRKHGE